MRSTRAAPMSRRARPDSVFLTAIIRHQPPRGRSHVLEVETSLAGPEWYGARRPSRFERARLGAEGGRSRHDFPSPSSHGHRASDFHIDRSRCDRNRRSKGPRSARNQDALLLPTDEPRGDSDRIDARQRHPAGRRPRAPCGVTVRPGRTREPRLGGRDPPSHDPAQSGSSGR